MTPTLGEQADLRAQLERAREALKARPAEKVSAVLTLMPELVSTLERVDMYQTEIADLRVQLIASVHRFRALVREAMRTDPDQTYQNAHIGAAAQELDHLLSRISELLGP